MNSILLRVKLISMNDEFPYIVKGFSMIKSNSQMLNRKNKYSIVFVMLCMFSCIQSQSNKDRSKNDMNTTSTDTVIDKLKIETPTGKSYIVDKDSQNLTAFYDKKVLWTTNINKHFPVPIPGKNSIRSIQLQNDCIFLIYGKHCFVKIDTLNGNIKDIECD